MITGDPFVVHKPTRKLGVRMLLAEEALAGDVVGIVLQPILKANVESQ